MSACWLRLILFLCVLGTSLAFVRPSFPKCSKLNLRVVPMRMVNIDLVARNLPLTPIISKRVNEKVGKALEKIGHELLSVRVALHVVKYPDAQHHTHDIKPNSCIAEASVAFKGGSVVAASEHSDDMLASIDQLAHTVSRLVKKHNDIMVDRIKKQHLTDEHE